jgi:soluble lytic murein transglycosylase-like protein
MIIERPLHTHPAPPPALIVKWIRKLTPKLQLDPALVLAVIRAESNFNPKAKSAKNTQGLMQLISGTAKRFNVSDVWDPLQNIRGSMAYLRWLLDHFNGDESLALAGYNAGKNAVRRYKGIPLFPETRSYVKRVSLWRKQALPRLAEAPRAAGKADKPA